METVNAQAPPARVDDVTCRKVLDEERDLLANGPCVVFKWADRAGWPVLYVSPNVLRIFGHEPARLLAADPPFSDLIHPDDLPRVASEVRDHLDHRRSHFQQHYRLRHGDGTWRWIEDYTTVARQQDGRVASINGYLIDVTRQKEAEARNLSTTSRLSHMTAIFPDGVLLIEAAEGAIRQFNQAAHQQLGYDAEAYRHLSLQALASGPEAAALLADRLAAATTGARQDFPLPMRRRDGSVMQSRVTLQGLTDDSHGTIMAVIRDVTEQHRSQIYLTTVLDTVVDGIITIGTDGIINSVNPAAESIFGYSRDEVLGHNVSILMPAPDSVRHDGYLRQYLATSRAGIIGHGREVTGLRKDGTTFPMYLAVSQAELEGRLFFTGVVRDITRQKKAEASLLAAKRDADLANRSKSEFLANMSHELRTPLNAVIGFSEIMMSELFGPVGSEKYADYVRSIHVSGSHLLSVINDILDISKIEAGQTELDESEVDVDQVVANCIKLMAPRATRAEVTVALDTPGAGLRLHGDRRRIKQMLLNLLSNAVKFTPAGGHVSIILGVTAQGEATVAVRDTGIGMSPDEIERALRPFEQLDGGLNRSFEGTGLGLPIVVAMAQLHGGRLAIRSARQSGTTATLCFPPGRLRSPFAALRERP